MRRTVLTTVFVIGLVCAGGLPAHAGDTKVFGASPTGNRTGFEVPINGAISDTLELRNHTNHALTLVLYPASATIGRDGVIGVGFKGSLRKGLASHISMPPTVRLKARGKQVVDLHVDAAGLAEPGLGAIVIEAAPTAATGTVQVVERIAILVRPVKEGAGTTTTTTGGSSVTTTATSPGLIRWWPLPMLGLAGFFLFFLLKRRRDDEEDEEEKKKRLGQMPAAPVLDPVVAPRWSDGPARKRSGPVPVEPRQRRAS